MRLNKIWVLGLSVFLVFSCNNNDDDGVETIPPRDRGEVAIENDQELIEYMSTHFYNYEDFENPAENFDYVVRFDTIAGENSDKTPIIESEDLITKTVNYQGVDQQLYILKVREGEGPAPRSTDSVFTALLGENLKGAVFQNNIKTPTWFNLSGYQIKGSNGVVQRGGGTIKGFQEGFVEFRASTGYEVLPDNTTKWNNDFGVGAIFMPSGLAYFSESRPNIPQYSPIIFSLNLYLVNVADHDGDGIPSYMEDLNGDGDAFNDDTDGDGLSNHSDADDDGDGTPTREEIEILEDGTIIFTDSNNDGTPDYLDPDVFK
ncbi:hypothetical protein MKO06_14865 [Gramella sp. GC03-9]|uniref:Uncharacterized protein n=1 Tax=Christiangramia oceanisediminis TaxID=2920386 RepID=A0A9X2KZM8_9FLAO|nr:hypothetical protein [Gramella oceanisediminis]MCP9201192.1 hypothetical protein [Gramella oceanisediminis]